MQNFKPKVSPFFDEEQLRAQRAPEQKAEQHTGGAQKRTKGGIKEIICPAAYAPIWQKAFALADNVRFTRTPDSELQRRRAALDPVYARILAEAEQAKAAREAKQAGESAPSLPSADKNAAAESRGSAAEKSQAAAESAGTAEMSAPQKAEPAAAAENSARRAAETEGNRRGETEQRRADAQAAFAAETAAHNRTAAETEIAAVPVVKIQQAQQQRIKAEALPAELEAAPAAETAAPPQASSAPPGAEARPVFSAEPAPFAPGALFPWEAGDDSREAKLTDYDAFYAPAAALAPVQAAPAALPRARVLPAADISRLFKSMECRRPQMRWIPVAAEPAEQAEAAPKAPGSAPPPDFAAHKAASGFQAFYAREDSVTASGSWAAPALNLQVRVENYSAARPSAAEFKAAEEKNAQPAGNLDALCSLAVEKAGAAAAAERREEEPRIAPALKERPEKTASVGSALQAETAEKLRAEQTEAENRVASALAAEQRRAAERQTNTKPRALPPQANEAVKYGYQLPDLTLLQQPQHDGGNVIPQESLERSAGLLESVLEDFGVKGEIIHVRPGPVVTLYEFEPAPGVKSARVINLSDDIARSMSSVAARVAVIPGRNVIGIELPNKKREMVYLREILQSYAYKTSQCKLPLALGKNIGGEPIIAELAKMPHLLVAGTTGSGKSVAINTMILSLLYRMTPSQCRLIMVDPKMLELSVYDGIPHLLTPVVTDPKKAITALKWAVREMEDRYRKMAKLGVRNIDGFNARVKEALAKGETIMCNVQAGFDKETGELLYTEEAMDLTPLPYIVIIVDEMADLMMVAGKEIEGAIQRLAQMARAAGIHLIMATQRPSVDVITGTIKANFPTRISFQVTSKIDSRTILGEQGAETLLGQGDMLQMAGGGRLKRVHGPFVSDREVEKIVAHLKKQGAPEYLATVTESGEEEERGKGADNEDSPTSVAEIVAAAASGNEDFDDLYVQAVKIVMRDKKCSTSYIQRRLGIGYNKAATLVEKMEEEGLVGEANHVGKREILA